VHDRDPAPQPEEPDDGLSIALEELDALNFDLPEEGAGATSGAPSSIRLSADVGEEIESHIDGLLTDVNRVTPKPSTGRDHDADSAVIEQLDLEQDLKSRRRTDTGSPAKPPGRATARTPATAPPRPRGDTQPERPAAATTTADLPSRQTAGKFQTEAFTRKDLDQPFPAVAEVQTEGGLARWSWVAIPLTVVIVFAAVFLMARPRPVSPVVSGPPPSTGVDSANPGTLQADPSALPLRPLDDPAPFAAAAAAAAAELAASS
ncbi:MAG: hypothetical protein GWN07_07360, partial [Actinobacteria bacterium]|nr:hypothetical protein [Actinomycetota bacterium]NIU65301.1 hypothetical protein [Actinomycetota bacterium]NIW27107.1 hypothetical protein [Actinomycetota bacterium]NIX19651.1 hypothetical protein [Actinomycetota bacterium]